MWTCILFSWKITQSYPALWSLFAHCLLCLPWFKQCVMYFLRNCLSSRLWYIDVRKHMVFLRSLTWAPRAFLGFLRTNQKGEAIRGRSWLVRRNAKLWDFSAILDFSAPISFSLDELPPSDWCGEIPKRSKLHKALRTPYRGWHSYKLIRFYSGAFFVPFFKYTGNFTDGTKVDVIEKEDELHENLTAE